MRGEGCWGVSHAEKIQVIGTQQVAANMAMWACLASPAPRELPTLQSKLLHPMHRMDSVLLHWVEPSVYDACLP